MAEWIEWAEPIAYGPLELKPWEFERLQPQEFFKLQEGYEWRKKDKEDTIAFFVSELMNLEGKVLKEQMTPRKLLAPIREPSKQSKQKESDAEYLMKIFNLNEDG